MKKNIIFLGLIILIYGFYFYLLPLPNIIKSAISDTKLYNVVYWNAIELVLHTFCGIGIIRLNKVARTIWLTYSICFILISTPFVIASIQNIFKGFHKLVSIPPYYLIQGYGIFFIFVCSLIFLNLPKAKILFYRDTNT